MPGKSPQYSLCFSPMLVLWESFPLFFYITFLKLRTNSELFLNSNNASLFASLLFGGLNALLFLQLHLLFIYHGVLYCLGVLFALYFLHEGHYFKLHQITSGSCNMDRFHFRSILCDQLAQIRHSYIEIGSKFFLLGSDNIDCCLQLSGRLWWVSLSNPL